VAITILPGGLDDSRIQALLEHHVATARSATALGSAHALDLGKLKAPDIQFWSAWDDGEPVGVGAIKRLSSFEGEVKSMHIVQSKRRSGVGTALLRQLIDAAGAMGLRRLSLETGAWPFFHPARALYKKHGFVECPPFGEYAPDPNSIFMTLELRHEARPTDPQDPPHFETVTRAGAARPWITMVHGASQHSGLFCAQVDAFQDDYRLLLVDLPGHGRSSARPGPYGIAEYARSVLAAMHAAAVERTHFWGTHTGAGVALLLAAQHPRLIASMVLDGAILPGVDLPYVTAAIARARKTARARGIEAARAEWFRESKWFDVIRDRPAECRAKAHWELVAEFSGRPWLDTVEPEPVAPIRAALGRIAQPVLLVNGEHDVADFIRVADEIESGIAGARRVSIPGAGGFPLWEFPAEVNALVRRFLERQADPAPGSGAAADAGAH